MKTTAKRLPLMGCLITLLLGAQTGFAADMMAQGMTTAGETASAMMEQPAEHAMGAATKDSMGQMMTHPETMKMEQSMEMKREYTVPSDAELRKSLTPLQYQVTRKEATEPAFKNAYWNNHDPGLYVDVISGVPLFSSIDKYDSGTGWPSFTKPIAPDVLAVKEDRSFFMVRNEVRSKLSDAHLGHVFDDGPKPTGLRYCMNSASLRFIPVADLEKEGYGDYVSLFK